MQAPTTTPAPLPHRYSLLILTNMLHFTATRHDQSQRALLGDAGETVDETVLPLITPLITPLIASLIR
jgi:hypothetical protein